MEMWFRHEGKPMFLADSVRFWGHAKVAQNSESLLLQEKHFVPINLSCAEHRCFQSS